MSEKLSCCGINVSHLTLDVTYQNNLGELFYLQVGNNNAGFKKLLEHTGQNCHFVMEATGVYYISLAFFILGLGKRATAFLIIFTQGFKHITNHPQLISFAGLSPTEYSSGTSIKGSNRIIKKKISQFEMFHTCVPSMPNKLIRLVNNFLIDLKPMEKQENKH